MREATTAYGAQVGTPQQSAAVLRALASRGGLELREASVVDLVAAVVGADVWARVCGIAELSRARVATAEARRAAWAVLARAAGYGDDGPRRAESAGGATDTVLAMVEQYRAWAAGALGPDEVRCALWRAGSDLVCGDERLEGAALVLQLAAELDEASP